MPYTMFIYNKKDKSSVPEIGDLFRVIDITHGVLDPSISGGRGTGVKLEPEDIDDSCVWKQDVHDEWNAWSTSCNELFCLDNETPKRNNMRYCCYCGRRLEEKVESNFEKL